MSKKEDENIAASTSKENMPTSHTPSVHVSVKPPNHLDITDSQSPAKTWQLWKQMWENYTIVTNLTSQSKEYQKAVFLCTIGQSALDIHNSFHFNDDEDRANVDTIISKFDEHFTGEINETYERFQFNRRAQQSGESFECYLTALRNLAKSCNFCKCMSESLIRDQVVLGIRDDNARKRLLQERKLDLKQCIDICRSTESANAQLGEISESFASVHKVENTKGKPWKPRQKSKPVKENKCKFCLTTHAFRKELCPAWG